MCGICGYFSGREPAADHTTGSADEQTLVHRGPDSDGEYFEPPLGMAMRRLAIIDLQGGDQPIANEDGSIAVVFNGEIYNFRELRAELGKRPPLRDAQRHRSDRPRLRAVGRRSLAALQRHVRVRAVGFQRDAGCCWRATGWARSRSTGIFPGRAGVGLGDQGRAGSALGRSGSSTRWPCTTT